MKSSEIERLLPAVYQRAATPGSPLRALLDAMETLHEPDEAVLAGIDTFFDPRRTAVAYLPMLSYWVNLDFLFRPPPPDAAGSPWSERPLPTAPGYLRELIASAAYLSQWRGTAPGLARFLEIATGLTGFTIDEAVPGSDGQPVPFHIRVRAPAAAQPHAELIERIIERQRPAYVTSELEFLADGGPQPDGANEDDE